MGVLLLGRWDHGGNLVVEESINTTNLDNAAVDALVERQDNSDGMAWSDAFDVATHQAALDEARETYLEDDGELIDRS